jgi:hypothetical protein
MIFVDLLYWPGPWFVRERSRDSQLAWSCVAILAFIAASSLAAAQSPGPPWRGQVTCNLDLQSQGYTRQETQSWTIAGPMLRMNGAMQIYPVTWTVSGSGSAQRLQNGLTSTVQWNTSVPTANLTFAVYVRASDRRLIFTQWGSQASSAAGIRGLQQAVWNGAQQQPAAIAHPAWEWHFPLIEADQADTNPSGTFSTPTEALPAELAGPRDVPAIANCAYHFSRGATSSQPVLAGNTVTTQKSATLSQTTTVNPSLGSAGAPKSISPGAISNGPAVQTYSGMAVATPSSTSQNVSTPSVSNLSTTQMLSSSQSSTANILVPGNTPTAPAQVNQTNSTDPPAGNVGNAAAPDTTSPTNTDGTSNPNASTVASGAPDLNANTAGTDPSASPNGTATQTVKVFLNPGNVPSFSYTWTPPAGVTQVTVQIWGGGGSGALGTGVVTASGGSGGGYSSKLLNVTPGVIYNIIVGGGGQGPNVFGNASGQDGFRSSISSGGKTLLFADGGYKGVLNLNEPVPGGSTDPSATVGQVGGIGTTDAGGPAFQSDYCPGFGITGRGGDANQYGQPGCIVLAW